LWLIGLGYLAVVAIAAAWILVRRLQEMQNPAEASGGMYAAGDLMLAIMLVLLFMIPSFFLVRMVARSEGASIIYSQLLVGTSLSAPLCLGLLAFTRNHAAQSLIDLGLDRLCLYRLVCSPLLLVWMVISRLVARVRLAKKLSMYGMLIEGASLAVSVVWFIRS
jgi:hypothetical protein